MDSIRQVDVDLNFLLVLYSTVGLYRLVCLSVGENRTRLTRPPSWLIGLLHSAHIDLESLMLSTNAGMTGVWFGRLDMCWENFWVIRIHWLPTQ